MRVLADDPFLGGAGERLPVFHWHHDTFDIPPGARHLAASDVYPNQAFRAGSRAWGLQFHLEVDTDLAAAWTSRLPPGVSIEAPAAGPGRRLLARFFAAAGAVAPGPE